MGVKITINRPIHRLLCITFLLFAFCLLFVNNTFAEDPKLQGLIEEALKNNHEILMAESKWKAATFKIPQSKSLPDPMFMFGYQNEGTRDFYTFGNSMMPDSQWMFGMSQMFPFPGKLSLKGEMALKDAEVLKASYENVKLKTKARVKELYYELFLAYKNIDFIKEFTTLFAVIEEAALSRYSSGMASQQEVLMAQIEKYMLLEKEEMLKQKIQSIEAMLNAVVGRSINYPIYRPDELSLTPFSKDINELIAIAYENSPEIRIRERMVDLAQTKVKMAKSEYYPDFTFTLNYFARSKFFPDMWSLTTTINVPIFYKTKQSQAVNEAESSFLEAQHELDAIELMLSSAIKDNYSMLKTAENLMALYEDGLIPKAYQDFEASLSGYVTGKTEAMTVISKLKSLIDFEIQYWVQFIEREKAIARLEAITGIKIHESEVKSQE